MSFFLESRPNLSRVIFSSLFVMLAQSVPTADVLAQEGIAEDFSRDPFALKIESYNLGSDLDGVSLGADGKSINFRASTSNTERGKIVIAPIRNSNINELSITAMLSSDTQFGTSDSDTAALSLTGYFYNDSQENGPGDDERTGDSRVSMGMFFEKNGHKFVWICFDRRNADGSKSVQPGANVYNGERCTGIATAPEFDKLHTMTIGYDKAAAKVYAQFDNERIEHQITTEHHTAQNAYKEIEIRANTIGTVPVGSIHSVKTNTFDISDLSGFAEEPKYKSTYHDTDIAVINGKLRLGVESDGSSSNETNRAFRALGETDYIESKIMLSSDSTLNGAGFNTVRLRNSFYNEVQDGGTGDDGLGSQAGDVFSALNLFIDENGEVKSDILIVRSENGNFSENTALSNTPDVIFPELKTGLALNTEYTASIRLDKEAKQLIFKLDDAEHVYNIQSDIHRASFVDGAGVDARVSGAGKTVAFADDFRTSPTAKTSEELAAEGGQTSGGTTGGTGTGSGQSTAGNTGSSETGGSSGGGGCTVGPAGSFSGFMFLMAMLVSFLHIRRRITSVKN